MMEWPLVRLDSLYNIARGGSPRPIKNYITDDPDGINWIKIGDATASGKYIYETKQKIRPEGIQRSRFVNEGDFILSNSMSFGRPYIMATTGCIHDGWLVLSPKDDRITQDFLYYILGSPFVFQQFDSLAAGSTVRNLNITLVSGVKIPLIPIKEQKRIVTILDQAFADIEQARAKTEQNLKNAHELFESYLQQVFSQRGEGWVMKEIGDLTSLITKGSSPKWQGINYIEEPGVLFVTSENVGVNQMIYKKTKYVEEAFNKKGPKSILAKGDVLTNIVGASIGRTAIFDRDVVANINQAVCLMRCNEEVLYNEYLAYLLNSPYLIKIFHDNEIDNARANLSLGFFRGLDIPVPSLEMQKTLVVQIKAMHSKTHDLEVIYQEKLHALDELKKSILQKAFSGELTKQKEGAAA